MATSLVGALEKWLIDRHRCLEPLHPSPGTPIGLAGVGEVPVRSVLHSLCRRLLVLTMSRGTQPSPPPLHPCISSLAAPDAWLAWLCLQLIRGTPLVRPRMSSSLGAFRGSVVALSLAAVLATRVSGLQSCRLDSLASLADASYNPLGGRFL